MSESAPDRPAEELAIENAHLKARLRELEHQLAQMHASIYGSPTAAQLVWKHSVEAFLMVDKVGVILAANPAAGQLCGCAAEQLLGRPLGALLAPENRYTFETELAVALRASTDRFVPSTFQGSLVGLDSVELALYPVRESGALLIVVRIVAAPAHNHAPPLTGMARGIIDDIHTLLMAIVDHTYQIRHSLGAASPAWPYSEALLHDAAQLGQIADSVSPYIADHKPTCIALGLGYFVQALGGRLVALLPRHLTLDMAISEPETQVSADPQLLRRLLTCMVLQAIDQLDGSYGSISLTTSTQRLAAAELGQLLMGDVRWPGVYAVLTVHSSGTNQPSPYVCNRVHVGRTMIYDITRSHAGALQIIDRFDYGSTVRVFLPVRVVADPPRAEAHIVLVEANQAVREVLRRMLERVGMHVFDCADVEEALPLLESGLIQLLLLDVGCLRTVTMPILQQVLTLQQIQLIISGSDDELTLASLMVRLGAAAFLQKPFDMASLEAVVLRVFRMGGAT